MDYTKLPNEFFTIFQYKEGEVLARVQVYDKPSDASPSHVVTVVLEPLDDLTTDNHMNFKRGLVEFFTTGCMVYPISRKAIGMTSISYAAVIRSTRSVWNREVTIRLKMSDLNTLVTLGREDVVSGAMSVDERIKLAAFYMHLTDKGIIIYEGKSSGFTTVYNKSLPAFRPSKILDITPYKGAVTHKNTAANKLAASRNIKAKA